MTTITYTATKPYSGNRPWADVTLNPGSKAVTLKCLVDTGADYVQINSADASAAGISLIGATAKPVSTVAGTATLRLVTGVQVTIETSKVLTIDVLVDTSNSTHPPLVGRPALLAAFDLGFDLSQWLST